MFHPTDGTISEFIFKHASSKFYICCRESTYIVTCSFCFCNLRLQLSERAGFVRIHTISCVFDIKVCNITARKVKIL